MPSADLAAALTSPNPPRAMRRYLGARWPGSGGYGDGAELPRSAGTHAHFNVLAEELAGGLAAVIDKHRLPYHVVTAASRGCITYRSEPVRSCRDYLEIDASMAYLSWLYQSNRGVLMAPGARQAM